MGAPGKVRPAGWLRGVVGDEAGESSSLRLRLTHMLPTSSNRDLADGNGLVEAAGPHATAAFRDWTPD
jgi:hypothetical protein